MCLRKTCRFVLAMLLLVASAANAQLAAGTATPPQSLDDALHQMTDKAAVIFAGQVIAIRQHLANDGSSGFVEIEFHVDQAVRGCTAGTSYTLREWAGLWEGGATRYRVGERLLMFLHAPGPSGLSSPVSGMDGAVPIDGGSTVMVGAATISQARVADLRWVNTHVLRPVSYRTRRPHFDHRSGVVIPFLDPNPMVRATTETAESTSVPVASALDQNSAAPTQQIPAQTVIDMLRSWQKANDATH